MAMLNCRLMAVKGSVERVGDGAPAECVLRRPDGGLFTCSLPAHVPALQRGDEISVILRGRPEAGQALGLVNHTVLDGENYVRLMARHRPDAWDGVLVSAAFVGVVSALGIAGLLPFVLLAALYGLLAGVLPMARRERFACRVDRLIDQEARSRGTVLQAAGATPARSDEELR